MMGQVKAPWTKGQVGSLSDFQKEESFHPFTCGKCGSILQATEEGWICPTASCDYTQDWAHDFMVDGSWKKRLEEMRKRLEAVREILQGGE